MEATESEGTLKADGALLLLTAFWGMTFVVVKGALADADPLPFVAMRFAVGALAAALLARRSLFDRRVLAPGVKLALFLFTSYALQTVGLTLTTPSRSAFLTGTCVLMVPLLSVALDRRLPSRATWVGVGLALGGIFVLTRGEAGAGASPMLLGDLLTLGCAVAYAFHIKLTERYSRGVPAAGLTAVQLTVVALLAALASPFLGLHVHYTRPLLEAVVFCGVFASAIAITVQTWGQARTSAVRAALVFSLEPLFATVFSWVLGRERLTVSVIGGGLLIVGGVLVSELAS